MTDSKRATARLVGWPDGTDADHMTFEQIMVGPSRRDAVPRSTAVEDPWAGMAALERPDDPIVIPAPSFGGGRSTAPWPKLDPDALHGPVGAFVRAAAPHTEADPAGLLVSTLVLLGGAIGGTPYVLAGNERHGAALFAVLVGATSKGRKGTAMAAARALVVKIDRDYVTGRLLGGFGSGEAMVAELRDRTDDDAGAADHRLCVDEPEFARLLKVAGRDHSILGQMIRHAWDGRRLEARSRAHTVVATNFHVAAVCQVSAQELRARLTDTETYGGTANRFLYVAVRRGELQPGGGNIPDQVLTEYGAILRTHVAAARKLGQITRTDAAEIAWTRLYHRLADDEPAGLLGAVIGRDSAQCLRLSLLYALLDGAAQIDAEHIQAAAALWNYSRATAAHVFGDRLGDQVADRLLVALRQAGPSGLDRAAQAAALGKHVTAGQLDVAAERLTSLSLAAELRTESTGGRPRQVLCACGRSGRRRSG